MALKLEDKKPLVAEVNEVAGSALSAIAAEYRGMTVAQMTEFRAKARNEGVYVRVVKNTLAKRAINLRYSLTYTPESFVHVAPSLYFRLLLYSRYYS